jgi:tRNA-2-methylthio-N6-dimethylallyladenosine synthase
MSGRARDGRLVHFTVPAQPGADTVRPGDIVHATVTYAAPHHLTSDAPLVAHRRTPAGDLHDRPAGVMVGMPTLRR